MLCCKKSEVLFSSLLFSQQRSVSLLSHPLPTTSHNDSSIYLNSLSFPNYYNTCASLPQGYFFYAFSIFVFLNLGALKLTSTKTSHFQFRLFFGFFFLGLVHISPSLAFHHTIMISQENLGWKGKLKKRGAFLFYLHGKHPLLNYCCFSLGLRFSCFLNEWIKKLHLFCLLRTSFFVLTHGCAYVESLNFVHSLACKCRIVSLVTRLILIMSVYISNWEAVMYGIFVS